MPMKKTGEVRASGKDLKYIIFGFLLFSVLGGLAWDTENISFCVYVVIQLVILFSLVVYMLLRWKNWRIILSDEVVIIRGTFGQKKEFPRDNVRWIITIPWGSRIYHLQLYNYPTGKQLGKIPLDWINVNILFNLTHYGPMTPEEKESYNYFRNQQS